MQTIGTKNADLNIDEFVHIEDSVEVDVSGLVEPVMENAGPATRVMPQAMRLTLIERIIDWFRGGVRAAELQTHFDTLCASSDQVSLQDRCHALRSLREKMNAQGRSALCLSIDPADGDRSTSGPVNMRVSIAGMAVIESTLSSAVDFAALRALATDPVFAMSVRAPEAVLERLDYAYRTGAEFRDITAAARAYCQADGWKEASAALSRAMDAYAQALTAGGSGTPAQDGVYPWVTTNGAYFRLVKSMSGFNDLEPVMQRQLGALAELFGIVAATSTGSTARKVVFPPDFILQTTAAGVELTTMGSDRPLHAFALPADGWQRACVQSAVLLLNAKLKEPATQVIDEARNSAQFVNLLLAELTDDVNVPDGFLSPKDVLDDPSINRDNYVLPLSDTDDYERMTIDGHSQFVARFGDKQVCFSDRGGAFEIRGVHLRRLLRSQSFGSLRELFEKVRGTEYDQEVRILCKNTGVEWEKMATSPYFTGENADLRERVLATMRDMPIASTTIGRVLDVQYRPLPDRPATVVVSTGAAPVIDAIFNRA